MNICSIAIFLLCLAFIQGQSCGPKHVRCLNSTSFSICVDWFGQIIDVGGVINCKWGYICSEDIGEYACIYDDGSNNTTDSETSSTSSTTSTTTTETTTIYPEKPAKCNKANKGNYPYVDDDGIFDCTKYYICRSVLGFWSFKLQECSSGTGYSVYERECVENGCDIYSTSSTNNETTSGETEITSDFSSRTTQTITSPFYSTSALSSSSASQYTTLSSLPSSSVSSSTVADITSDLSPSTTSRTSTSTSSTSSLSSSSTNEFTTLSSTINTSIVSSSTSESTTSSSETTTLIPEKPEKCNKANKGNYPYIDDDGVLSCSKYYECRSVLGFWSYKMQTCKSGTGYSTSERECVEKECND